MNSGEPMLIRAFLQSAGAVLFVTATAKVVSSLGTARILASQDIVLNISYQNYLLIGSYAIALRCWYAKVAIKPRQPVKTN